MAPEAFTAYFDQWEGEQGQQLWLRNVRGFDEQHTAEFEPLLDAMATPTLLVWGEQDRWLPVEVSATIQSRLPNAERRLIPDAGHCSPEDQPGRVAEAISDFCRS